METSYTACTVNAHHCKCFDSLTKEEAKLVDEHSVTIKYKKGEVICKQGGFVSQIIFVETGLVKVFIENGGNSLVLKIIPDGNIVGWASVSELSNTFQYSASAYTDTVVRQIDVKLIRQLISTNPLFARDIIDVLSANSIQIYGRFLCLTRKQSYGRLADILLCLTERIFKSHEFDLPLSRKDLAELTAMSPETVIRILKKFDKDGLIKISGKKFKVIDFERLQRISESG